MDQDFDKPLVKEKPCSQLAIEEEHNVLKSDMQEWTGKTEAAIKSKLTTVNKLVKHVQDITTFSEILKEKSSRYDSLYSQSMDHIQVQMNKNSDKLSIEQLLEQYLKKINKQTKLINILRDSKNDMKAFRK